MNDQCKTNSKIKRGLMVLNKLKESSPMNDHQKSPNGYNRTNSHHQPEPEKDLKKFQCQVLSTEDFMLSNADFQVKNLITGFLEGIDEVDKSKVIESKIKVIKESQYEFEKNKLIEVIDDDCWTKSKTKFQRFHSKKGMISSKNLNKHLSSKVLENKYFDNTIKQDEFMDQCHMSNLKQNNNNISKPSDVIRPVPRLKFTSNQIYEIPGINAKDKIKLKHGSNMVKKGNSCKNILKHINKAALDKEQKTNDTKRSNIPSGTQRNFVTFADDNNMNQKKGSAFHRVHTYSKEAKNNIDDSGDIYRKMTYSTKIPKKENKEIPNEFDNMSTSYLRFKTKDNDNHSIKKNRSIKEINILNIQGLSQRNQNKLNKICNELKSKVVGADELENTIITKEEEENKPSTIVYDNTFNLQSLSTVVFDEKFRVLTKKGYVYDSLDDEEFEDEIEGLFYIHPNSIGILIFDALIFFSTLYFLIYMPYSLAHDLKYGMNRSMVMKVVDYTIDCLFFLDIIIRFLLGYHNFEEMLITKNEDIAIHYLSSWFICDLIASLPFNSFLFLTEYTSKSFPNYYNTATKDPIELISIIRIIKVSKLFQANKFSVKTQDYLLEFLHFKRWSKVYLSLVLLLLSVHLLSCIFIYLGQTEYPNWIIKQKLDTASFETIYITSVYYILATVFTVGYGDITPVTRTERLNNLFLLVVGIMVYSWALSSISTYIQFKDSKTIEYQKKKDILEEIRISHEKMPFDLYDKIQRFLRYRIKHEKKDKSIIFDSLPIGLRNNLIHEMYKPVIDNFIFFKNFKNNDFIVRVILAFKPILGLKNDILVKEGDYIEEIIFVKRGNLSLEIPLPIVVSPETMRKTKTNFTKTFTKTLKGAYTFNNNKNIYSLENPTFCKGEEGLQFKKTFGVNERNIRVNSPKNKESEIDRSYVKILEIRKNEHFGDILMFLNRRSPLSVKVKSKYAEMFFLKKTDAVEISMSYPKIWRTINKKSLFNMQQIDRLIDKALKLFFISNEGKKNLNHNSKLLETMIANVCGQTKIENSIYPRTQEEIIKLIQEDSDKNRELRSIPSNISSSIIIEESYHSQDGNKSSYIDSFQLNRPKEERDPEINSSYDSDDVSESSKQETSELQSTEKLNTNKKSIHFSNSPEEKRNSNKLDISCNERNHLGSSTPFQFSDVNTEIYPNEEGFIFDIHSNTIAVNDYIPSQRRYIRYSLTSSASSRNKSNGNNIFRNDNCRSGRSIDDCSENSLASRDSKMNIKDTNMFNLNKSKTVKKLFPGLSMDHVQKRENHSQNSKKAKKINNILKKSNIFSRLSYYKNTTFTINSKYNNINEMNRYDISATKGLLMAILTMNVSEIEKALKKCNFGFSSNHIKRNSVSSTSLSIRKDIEKVSTLIRNIPVRKKNTLFHQNGDIKTTNTDVINNNKRKLFKSNSISSDAYPSKPFLVPFRDIQLDNQNPIEQKKISMAKFTQSKDDFLNKSPTINNFTSNNSKNNRLNLPMINVNYTDQGDNQSLMINKRLSFNPLKQSNTIISPKKDLLNVISENIEKNSQNLNNPDLFYLEYFQKIMNKNNDLKDHQNLYKRLEDAEKFLFDSVSKNENNNTYNSNNT